MFQENYNQVMQILRIKEVNVNAQDKEYDNALYIMLAENYD
jgi:hypothetical protein